MENISLPPEKHVYVEWTADQFKKLMGRQAQAHSFEIHEPKTIANAKNDRGPIERDIPTIFLC